MPSRSAEPSGAPPGSSAGIACAKDAAGARVHPDLRRQLGPAGGPEAPRQAPESPLGEGQAFREGRHRGGDVRPGQVAQRRQGGHGAECRAAEWTSPARRHPARSASGQARRSVDWSGEHRTRASRTSSSSRTRSSCTTPSPRSRRTRSRAAAFRHIAATSAGTPTSGRSGSASSAPRCRRPAVRVPGSGSSSCSPACSAPAPCQRPRQGRSRATRRRSTGPRRRTRTSRRSPPTSASTPRSGSGLMPRRRPRRAAAGSGRGAPVAVIAAGDASGHRARCRPGPRRRSRAASAGTAAAGPGPCGRSIFGVSDGLVSNLALVMGVAGASGQGGFILLAGIAGLLAGAFSHGGGRVHLDAEPARAVRAPDRPRAGGAGGDARGGAEGAGRALHGEGLPARGGRHASPRGCSRTRRRPSTRWSARSWASTRTSSARRGAPRSARSSRSPRGGDPGDPVPLRQRRRRLRAQPRAQPRRAVPRRARPSACSRAGACCSPASARWGSARPPPRSPTRWARSSAWAWWGSGMDADEISARLRAEGLDPGAWSNGPGDRYAPHEHGYDKVLACAAGSIRFGLPARGDHGGPRCRRPPRPAGRHAPRRDRRARRASRASRRTCPPGALRSLADGPPGTW